MTTQLQQDADSSRGPKAAFAGGASLLSCGCGADAADNPASLWRWGRIIFAAILAVNTMAVTLAINTTFEDPAELARARYGLIALTFVVILLVAGPLLRSAWKALRQRRVAVEFLFLLTLGGALVVSAQSTLRGAGDIYYDVVAILLVVYAFGAELNRSARERALLALEQHSRAQRPARVRDVHGIDHIVAADAVSTGDLVVLLPGEMAAVDGVLLQESALLEESSLRGEFAPRQRKQGERIRAGSATWDEQVLYEARPRDESDLDQLLCATESTLSKDSAMQQAADRVSRWLLPIVASTALLTFLVWSQFVPWAVALFHAMAVLLVACPCALGFGTPLALNTAINRLRFLGIELRRSADVEALAAVDTVVFDKTGTLSPSEATLDAITWQPTVGFDDSTLTAMLLAAESGLQHPYAHAIRRRCAHSSQTESVGVTWRRTQLRVVPGVGIEATVDNGAAAHRIVIRSSPSTTNREAEQGVEILLDSRVVGHAQFQEQLHPARYQAWRQFAEFGVSLHLLTGDQPERAARAGIAQTYASVSAVEKQQHVLNLRGAGHRVLFVGDGMNDAAAMTAADVSLAVAHGSPLAVAVASGSWTGEDPRQLVAALQIARETLHRVQTNFRWAIGYNIAGMALAAGGVLHPVTAALLMTGSSIIVTWRALSLLNSGDGFATQPEYSGNMASPVTHTEGIHAVGNH